MQETETPPAPAIKAVSHPSHDERVGKFVTYQRHLAYEGHEDRAALADLRSGLRRRPGDFYPATMARMAQHITPSLGEGWNPDPKNQYDDGYWFFIVGALFASHPVHTDSARSFGESYAAIAEKSDSIKARFTQLLNSRSYTLPDYLRQAVSLLDSANVAINYYRLLEDCLHWDAPGRPVQLKWARDFYITQERNKAKEAGDTPAVIDTP